MPWIRPPLSHSSSLRQVAPPSSSTTSSTTRHYLYRLFQRYIRNVPQRHRRPSAPRLPALHSDVDSQARLPPFELLVQQESRAPSWLQGEDLLAHDAAAPAEPHQDKRQQVCGLHHPRRRSRGPRVLLSPVPTRPTLCRHLSFLVPIPSSAPDSHLPMYHRPSPPPPTLALLIDPNATIITAPGPAPQTRAGVRSASHPWQSIVLTASAPALDNSALNPTLLF